MRLWKRRKVIYEWDNNFAPTVDHYPELAIDTDFIWRCPADSYIRITAMCLQFNGAPGVRPPMNLYLDIYHANAMTAQTFLKFSPVTSTIITITVGPNYPDAPGAAGYYSSIPSPSRMIPGGWLRAYSLPIFHGDKWQNISVSYDRYEL